MYSNVTTKADFLAASIMHDMTSLACQPLPSAFTAIMQSRGKGHGCYAQYKIGNLVCVWELAARQQVFPRIVFSTD